jgi:hypothetical protein
VKLPEVERESEVAAYTRRYRLLSQPSWVNVKEVQVGSRVGEIEPTGGVLNQPGRTVTHHLTDPEGFARYALAVLRLALLRSYALRSHALRSYALRSHALRSYALTPYALTLSRLALLRSHALRSYALTLSRAFIEELP